MQDTRLPKGSYVVVTGMADGRVLYELMSKRYHPLGQLNEDITYSNVYEFLSCLQCSPCNGWMTVNATLRNFTSEVSSSWWWCGGGQGGEGGAGGTWL